MVQCLRHVESRTFSGLVWRIDRIIVVRVRRTRSRPKDTWSKAIKKDMLSVNNGGGSLLTMTSGEMGFMLLTPKSHDIPVPTGPVCKFSLLLLFLVW